MGTALTVRDLIGERLVFRREQAVGLSTSAISAAKIAVFAAIAVVQSAVLVLVVTAPRSASALRWARRRWAVRCSSFSWYRGNLCGAAILGLFLSALAQNSDQVISADDRRSWRSWYSRADSSR